MSDINSNQKKESRLLRKLRMTIFVDKSFEEIITFRFAPWTLAVSVVAMAILLIAGVTILIAFTGLREYIPGYPTGEERRAIIQNMQRADSLINEVELRDLMLRNMRDVLRGDLPESAWRRDSNVTLTRQSLAAINSEKSGAETKFVREVEQNEEYDIATNADAPVTMNSELESTFFFTPAKGVVTNHFEDGHYGVDVSIAESTPVLSTLDGIVFFSEWTLQTGFVMMVQHDNQLVSVYKHNAKLLKQSGQRVSAGECLALTGNSGEFTTGPHLHFELWYKGTPLNPENYINFELEK